MSAGAWFQLVALVVALAVATPILGRYLAGVLTPTRHLRAEKAVYRLTGIDPDREQTWSAYALAVLAFSLISALLLYLLQRTQGVLPGNPSGFSGVKPAVAWNTAVSFLTNTNWQSYAGESTMSHLTQMAGLAVQNFLSAAVGIAVAAALIRGLVRQRTRTLGNFWVDITRITLRVLLPICAVVTIVFVSQGVVQNFRGHQVVTTVEQGTQAIPGGPVASQEAIKQLGTNGGGFYNANSAHPFENPTSFTNWLQIFLLLAIPFALTYAYGRMVGDQKQGWVVFAAMALLWGASVGVATWAEDRGNTRLPPTVEQSAGNMEGKEVRFGSPASALYAASTTGTSTGAVNASHDSFTPAGGAVPLVNIMLGEVSPGGTGSGLYGMLVFALLSVFIAGLMVGRTPEYLGKKIQASEMKLAVLYLVAVPVAVLGFAGASSVIGTAFHATLNAGSHGLTEITYAFASAANNNGSAFGGLTVTGNWYEITLGLSMLIGRFLLIVPVLAIAGSLAGKKKVPATAGTFPTGTPLFAGLLTGVVVIVVGLTYFPVIALGPLAEHLAR